METRREVLGARREVFGARREVFWARKSFLSIETGGEDREGVFLKLFPRDESTGSLIKEKGAIISLQRNELLAFARGIEILFERGENEFIKFGSRVSDIPGRKGIVFFHNDGRLQKMFGLIIAEKTVTNRETGEESIITFPQFEIIVKNSENKGSIRLVFSFTYKDLLKLSDSIKEFFLPYLRDRETRNEIRESEKNDEGNKNDGGGSGVGGSGVGGSGSSDDDDLYLRDRETRNEIREWGKRKRKRSFSR